MKRRPDGREGQLPPRWIEVVMGWSLPVGLRHEVLEDLAERFSQICAGLGYRAAIYWYGGQLLRMAPKLLVGILSDFAGLLRGGGSLNAFFSDIRFAFRNFVRAPVFAAVAIITLALGIGANTAIFSIVDGILLRPMEFPKPTQLVTVWSDYTERNGPLREWLSYPNYVDMRGSELFEELSIYGGWRPTLTGRGAARQLNGAAVSEGMFSRVLKVSPIVGRGFTPEEDVPNGPAVALISHSLWQSEFSRNTNVVGETVTLDGAPVTIIGVMPAGFTPPFFARSEIWTPMGLDLASSPARAAANLRTVGRLSSGVTLAGAQLGMRELASRLESAYPEANEDVGIALFSLHDDLVRDAKAGLWLLLGAVIVVLLIASINVANLMLARTMARRSEMAVRAALGAGSGRIVKQLLTEGCVLAAVGGVLGVVLGRQGLKVLVGLAPETTPLLDQVGLDGRVLGFAAVSTIIVSVLFGLVPALNVTRGDLNDHLRAGRVADVDQHSQRTGRVLVAGQIALTLALLVASSLLIQTLSGLRSVDTGFKADARMAFRFFLPTDSYDRDGTRDYLIRLEDHLARIPGVIRIGSVSALPLSGRDSDTDFIVEGDPPPAVGEVRSVWFRSVTPNYLSAMEIAVVKGRGFRDTDDQEAPMVALINEEMAERYFGDRDPIGMRINVNDPANPVWREIVGVTENIKNFGVRNDSRYVLHIPHRQIPFRSMNVALHTNREDPLSLLPEIRATMVDLDPNIAAAGARSMSDALEDSFGGDRFVTVLLSLFSGLSLLLSMVGLYGIVSYSVSRRQREMGVRIAVGASAREIRGLVVNNTLRLVFVGAVAGLAASLVGVRFVESLLFGVGRFDLRSFVSAVGILATVSVAAALVPAVRASRVDPVTVLKAE